MTMPLRTWLYSIEATNSSVMRWDAARLVDPPRPAAGLRGRGVTRGEAVLLTHHRRDASAAAGTFLAARVPVRAPVESAEWLTSEGVRKYWQESLPLRNSRTAYLV